MENSVDAKRPMNSERSSLASRTKKVNSDPLRQVKIDVGKRLKRVMVERDCQQKDVAEITTVSAPFISEIANGNKMPGGEILLRLKQKWDVSCDWLLTGEGAPTGDSEIDVDALAAVGRCIDRALERVAADRQKSAGPPVVALQITNEVRARLMARLYNIYRRRAFSKTALGELEDAAAIALADVGRRVR